MLEDFINAFSVLGEGLATDARLRDTVVGEVWADNRICWWISGGCAVGAIFCGFALRKRKEALFAASGMAPKLYGFAFAIAVILNFYPSVVFQKSIKLMSGLGQVADVRETARAVAEVMLGAKINAMAGFAFVCVLAAIPLFPHLRMSARALNLKLGEKARRESLPGNADAVEPGVEDNSLKGKDRQGNKYEY
jgi:hypothetical protein